MKLDTITRLAGVKSNVSGDPAGKSSFAGQSLLHLTAWECASTSPDLLDLFEGWNAVLAAAEISFRQV